MNVYWMTTTEIGQKGKRTIWERRAAQFGIFGIYMKDIQAEVFRGQLDIVVWRSERVSGWGCGFDSYHVIWEVE